MLTRAVHSSGGSGGASVSEAWTRRSSSRGDVPVPGPTTTNSSPVQRATTSVVRTAIDAGAERVVMCDTNGGMLPSMITAAINQVVERSGVPVDQLGIHCQNDTACAVANTVAAVEAGVEHFQCTANGYGERPGNADLFAR